MARMRAYVLHSQYWLPALVRKALAPLPHRYPTPISPRRGRRTSSLRSQTLGSRARAASTAGSRSTGSCLAPKRCVRGVSR